MGRDLKGRDLGANISQRKDGRYQARFTNKLGKREEYCNRELHLVREWLAETRAKDLLNMNILDKSLTLDTWFEKWLQEYKYDVVRESTRTQYKLIYTKHIKPILGKSKLSEITHLQIKALINKLDKDGYMYDTKNKVRIILLDMFNKAVLNDYAIKNPARSIKVERDEQKEPRVLTLEEQKLFLDYSKGTFYDNMFVVGINSGLRPGEIYALTENDLDFDNKIIKVSKTLIYQKLDGDTKKEFHIGPPKTKSSYRNVKMTRACEIALRKQIEQSKIIKKKTPKVLKEEFKDLLFTTKFGTPINSEISSEAIEAIVNGINLIRDELEQIEKFSGHCFRHTFASNCYHNGISMKTIQKLLGHTTLKMTMDKYVHVFGIDIEESMDKLSEAMDKLDDYNESIENFDSAM